MSGGICVINWVIAHVWASNKEGPGTPGILPVGNLLAAGGLYSLSVN